MHYNLNEYPDKVGRHIKPKKVNNPPVPQCRQAHPIPTGALILKTEADKEEAERNPIDCKTQNHRLCEKVCTNPYCYYIPFPVDKCG